MAAFVCSFFFAAISMWLSNETINSSFETLSQIFDLAILDRKITIHPCHGIKKLPSNPPREIHPASVEAIIAFADAVAEQVNERYRAPILFMGLGTGVRPGEMWGLHLEAVNFLRKTVRIHQRQSIKGRTRRTVSEGLSSSRSRRPARSRAS